MTKRADFLRFWQSSYPQTPPVSYLFKRRLADRWARIHSLPQAKRYADTEAEWETLLRRQNAVMKDLLGDWTQADMVFNSYSASNPVASLNRVIYLGAFAVGADPEEDAPVHTHLVTLSLDEKSLDPLLRQIADDRLRAFFIGKNCLIAPYDGGMDLILENVDACQAFKEKYADWLSERADGL
jgi:hypothetical protein